MVRHCAFRCHYFDIQLFNVGIGITRYVIFQDKRVNWNELTDDIFIAFRETSVASERSDDVL